MRLGVAVLLLALTSFASKGRLARLSKAEERDNKLETTDRQEYSYPSTDGSKVEAAFEYGPHHVDHWLRKDKKTSDQKGRSESHVERSSYVYTSDPNADFFKKQAEEFVKGLPEPSGGGEDGRRARVPLKEKKAKT